MTMTFLSSFITRNRSLSDRKQLLLQEVLPKFRLDADTKNFGSATANQKVNLEIGCGVGEFISKAALLFSSEIFIGCEPYINGVATLLEEIQQHSINNILIWPDDARVLLQSFAPHNVDNLFILFPDPWPKTRHHKRRLINQRFLELIAEKMKKNGLVHIATDHQNYAEHIKNCFASNDKFTNNCSFNIDDSEYLRGLKTTYQQKAKSLGLTPAFYQFIIN